MLTKTIRRCLGLTSIFIKEQVKEPTAFFWTILSPTALFYLLSYSKGYSIPFSADYTKSTSWFYAYVSSSVAFFGFAFYIIGRRESGFIRSFIYKSDARTVFFLGHFLAYSIISVIYCLTFYLLTRPAFGPLLAGEALDIVVRFYVCFLLFCIPGLLLTLLPVTFQNANTCISIASFFMLLGGIYGSSSESNIASLIRRWNPLAVANDLIAGGVMSTPNKLSLVVLLFFASSFIAVKFMRINPVWSRY